MPENDNSIPLDDEDILDLTVVAEPGKTPEAPKPDGPPEPGDSGADFGADLDALLDSLGVDGSAPAVAPPAAEAVSPAPIADQTPVDHKVDPNEELAMPEMLDIDSLLAELGAEVPADAPEAAPGPEAPPAKPPSAEEEPQAQAPMPEFDSILAQAQAAEARKAEEEAMAVAVEAMPQAAEVAAEDVFPAAPAGEQAPMPAEAGQTPPQSDVPGPAERYGDQDAALDAAREAAPAEDPEENIDLNELDALLDDILATAPEMSVAAPAAAAPLENTAMETAAAAEVPPEAAEAPAPVAGAPEVLPVPDQAIMPVAEDVAALAARVRRLEEAEDIAALLTRVQRLEEAVDALEAGKMSETMVEGLIAAKLDAGIAAMFEPGSPVMDRIVTELMGRMAGGAFNETLEKMAAAAAAKVIREEIAALMQENG